MSFQLPEIVLNLAYVFKTKAIIHLFLLILSQACFH